MDNCIEKRIPERKVTSWLIRFYAIGFLLYAIPFTRVFFVSITALTLLFVFVLVFMYHHGWDKRNIRLFLSIILTGFFLEMAGTNTGLLFGEYSYGRGLGFKIHGTPVIIGLNWLFLTYASSDIATRLVKNKLIRIFTGALLMVAYDLLLEWVAPYMQMWRFASIHPPVQNYLVWFVTALLFHTAFTILHIHTDNLPARRLFVIQACFFVIIGCYSEIFII